MLSDTALALGGFSLAIAWLAYNNKKRRHPLDGLDGPKPTSLWQGNMQEVWSREGSLDYGVNLARKYGGAVRTTGIFGIPEVHVTDARALHTILIKDQYKYEETKVFTTLTNLMFGQGLLATLGDQHKKQRRMLNPVFSIAHLRYLSPIFSTVGQELCEIIDSKIENGQDVINTVDWFSRAALEIIARGGLGYKMDALDENTKNPYCLSVKNLTPSIGQVPIALRVFSPMFVKIGTPSFREWFMSIVPYPIIQEMRSICNIMDTTSRSILKEKYDALARGDEAVVQQVGSGKDIMSILLRANDAAEERDRLTPEEILGQMSTLMFAAHDTTSNALARMFWLLCQHPYAQAKIRDEVREARKIHGDEFTYDQLMALPYLDAVCREMLRLYPPVPFVLRECVGDGVIPLGNPVRAKDGVTEIRELHVPKNTLLYIDITASNRSYEYWGQDADEWNPERWMKPLPEKLREAHVPGVYSSMMTFIGGGRGCIGFKFAELELKTMLAAVLERFFISATNADIRWMNGPIITPHIRGKENELPQLPIRFTRLVS